MTDYSDIVGEEPKVPRTKTGATDYSDIFTQKPKSFVSSAGDIAKSVLPEGMVKAGESGFRESSSALTARVAKGETGMPDHYEPQGFLERGAETIGGLVGDIPTMAVGAAAGSVVPLVGTTAGAFALPAVVREAAKEKLTGEKFDPL